jgi:hypothetical protein
MRDGGKVKTQQDVEAVENFLTSPLFLFGRFLLRAGHQESSPHVLLCPLNINDKNHPHSSIATIHPKVKLTPKTNVLQDHDPVIKKGVRTPSKILIRNARNTLPGVPSKETYRNR